MIKAIGDWIIIKPAIDPIKKTKGGLELSEQAREDIRYKKGEVVSSGVDVLKCCDIVMYDRVAGHSIEEDGEVLSVIRLRDVVGICNDQTT